MKETTFQFWRKWLSAVNGLIVVLGLLIAFAGNSLLFDLHNQWSGRVFFGEEGITAEVLRFKNWLFGIIGATIAGYHLLMVMLSEYAFRRREKWAWQAMSVSLLLWFIVDSGISLYYGAVHNVILINLVALLLIGLPLLATRGAVGGAGIPYLAANQNEKTS